MVKVKRADTISSVKNEFSQKLNYTQHAIEARSQHLRRNSVQYWTLVVRQSYPVWI